MEEELLVTVMRFPEVPLTVNEVTVVVSAAVNCKVCGGLSILRSLNVFPPPTMKDPVPVPESQRLLYVNAAPVNVLFVEVESVYFMVDPSA